MLDKWKVMIADDEGIIREGIRQCVDWDSLGMTVVAEAEDGEEALELAVQHSIHIALVDLNMPIMHGMELMKRLREQLPGCKIIVITGHDEFSYAQESIRLQVNDYILKPAEPKQLMQVLRGVRDELESERQQSQHLQQASRQLQKNFPLLRERFCQEWLDGNLSQAEIREQLQFLQLPPERPERIGIVRWRWEGQHPGMKENERQLFLFAIENIITELLEPYTKVIFRDTAGLVVALLWDDAGEQVFAGVEGAVRSNLKIAVEVGTRLVLGRLQSWLQPTGAAGWRWPKSSRCHRSSAGRSSIYRSITANTGLPWRGWPASFWRHLYISAACSSRSWANPSACI